MRGIENKFYEDGGQEIPVGWYGLKVFMEDVRLMLCIECWCGDSSEGNLGQKEEEG